VSALRTSLFRIAADLDDLRARWAVVGGLAVSARAEPRLTRDVDVAVAVADDAAAERLIADLRGRGYELEGLVEHTAVSRLATARLLPDARGAIVDLLFASSGIEEEIVAAAERILIVPTLSLPVARAGELIALKLLVRDDRNRPQDFDDLRALLAVATPGDLADARSAVRLIVRRGYARGRDLETDFAKVVSASS
jgi:single-stranded DNA-specific DHH superfamily exonuclease